MKCVSCYESIFLYLENRLLKVFPGLTNKLNCKFDVTVIFEISSILVQVFVDQWSFVNKLYYGIHKYNNDFLWFLFIYTHCYIH